MIYNWHVCNVFRVAFPTIQLLAGQKKSAPFWTFEYYQTFFDVDTYQVSTPLSRRTHLSRVLPRHKGSFLLSLLVRQNCVFL